MKTSVKSLLALTMTAIVLSTSAWTSAAFAIEKNRSSSSAAAAKMKFNKIVVSGNVRVTVVHGNGSQVSAYDGFDAAQTSIVQKGYTLYINSTEAETVNVTIRVNDLQRIDASNGAIVKTAGHFDLPVLQVFLKDDAKVNVKAKIGSLYTVIKDQSDLKLSGSTSEHILVRNQSAKLDTLKFAALKTKTTVLRQEGSGHQVLAR